MVEPALASLFAKLKALDESVAHAFPQAQLGDLLAGIARAKQNDAKQNDTPISCQLSASEITHGAFCYDVTADEQLIFRGVTPRTPHLAPSPGKCCLACGLCGTGGFCNACCIAYYCSKRCQRAHFHLHRSSCKAVCAKPPEPSKATGPIVHRLRERWNIKALLREITHRTPFDPDWSAILCVLNQILHCETPCTANTATITVPYRELYPKGALIADFGYPTLSKARRCALAAQAGYKGLRCRNTGPVIMHQACATFAITAPCLQRCANNRDEVLQQIFQHFTVSEPVAKKWLLTIVLLEDETDADLQQALCTVPFLAQLKTEMQWVAPQLRLHLHLSTSSDRLTLRFVFCSAARLKMDFHLKVLGTHVAALLRKGDALID